MTSTSTRLKHPAEWISIASALLLAAVAVGFFWYSRGWSPDSDTSKYLLGWMVIGYVAIRLITLLESAVNVRLSGLLNIIVSIIPFVVGLAVLLNAVRSDTSLSAFHWQALLMLLATTLIDFVVTLWVRFAISRRTIEVEREPRLICEGLPR